MIIKDWLSNEPKPTIVCVVISAVSLILSLGGWLKNLLPLDIAWIAIILCGIPILVGALIGLIRDHDIKADVLVSMALVASVVTGEFFAAGEVAFIMQIGSLLEYFTANRARNGIESLIKITPKTAHVIQDDKETTIPVEDVVCGDVISVLAGETIPVDGILLSGQTSVDQSVMTGESIPVDKKEGDELISGTVNQLGVFRMIATKTESDSSLQRMIRLAEDADANKAPIVELADKWASWMVVIALACAILTWIITGEFMRAVTVLVVFCPCAFILATPTAVAAAIGNATKYGILIRTGDALERLSKIQTVTFDKTGTLTYGKPQVIGVEAFDGTSTKDDILLAAASAELKSEHPLGKAIVENCKATGTDIPEHTETEVLAGLGIKALLNGKEILIGKPEFFRDKGMETSSADKATEQWYKKGATVVYISLDGKLSGLIALADTVREDAAETIRKIKNGQITPALLTGDNEAAAGTIAKTVGIEEVHANLLPEGKMELIQRFENGGRKVYMIGDGVNDALALSTAYAGVAMGGIGSDIAVESADAVLVSDDIKRLPYLFSLSSKTMRKVKQNIIISMCINLTAILLSGLGILTPITGALWHNFGSVFVVVNAALLLRQKDN